MRPLPKLLISLLAVTALTACSPYHETGPWSEPGGRDVRVEQKRLDDWFLFTAHRAQFPETERNRLEVFLSQYPPLSVNKAVVELDGQDPLVEARQKAIRHLLRGRGILDSVTHYVVTPTAKGGEFHLIVDYNVAVMPDCPNWSKNATHNYTVTNDSNFGCATASLFSNQVANPADLLGNTRSRPQPDPDLNLSTMKAYKGLSSGGSASSGSSGGGGGSSSSGAQ